MTCGAPCLIIGHNHPEALNPQDDTVIATLLAEQLLVESGLGHLLERLLPYCRPEQRRHSASAGPARGGTEYTRC